MRSLPVVFAAVVASTTFAADTPPALPPASTQTGVTYEKDIRPLFEASCFRCHGEQRQKGRIRLDSLEAVLKGGEHGPIVIPGDSAKSQLVLSIARVDPETAMPPMRRGNSQGGGPPGAPPPAQALTPEQVGLVRAWIDQGAK